MGWYHIPVIRLRELVRLFRVSTLLICVACFCFGRKDRRQVEGSLRPGSFLRFTEVGLH